MTWGKSFANRFSLLNLSFLFFSSSLYLLFVMFRSRPPSYIRPLEIRVFGIPESGTKSRVETQIKLGLELIDARGERVREWSHIKLPTHMVAREKLKRINGKNPQADANPVSGTALHESQVLQLDATVVCASELTREVIMCFNCVHREVSIFTSLLHI
jgi:hypothetical protein